MRLSFLLDQESLVTIIPGTEGRHSTLVVYLGVKRSRDRRGALVVQNAVRTKEKRREPFQGSGSTSRNTIPGKNDLFNAYNTSPDADGNITVTFSVEDPEDGTYWMPVTAGEPYYFIVRYSGADLNALPPRPCEGYMA